MSKIKAKRYHDISAGHRVHGHESKCAHLHGHNYRFHFTCEADPAQMENKVDSIGRVIDFGVIKERLAMWLEDNWDHKFLVWSKDPMSSYLKEIDPDGTVVVPFNPTAEGMAEYMVIEVGPSQLEGTGVILTEVVIDETAKCSASFEV